MHAIEPTVVGAHGGGSLTSKAVSLAGRTARLHRHVRRFAPSLAVAHGSNDLALVARLLGVPTCNTFDYEWATLQHNVGCRLARRVLVPEAIPLERLRRYGVTAQRLRQYPGIKEEYYLADFEPDRGLLGRLDVDHQRTVVVVRPPPDVSLYHRRSNPLYIQVLQHIGHDAGVHAVVIPRTQAQRSALRAMALPSVIVPEGAIRLWPSRSGLPCTRPTAAGSAPSTRPSYAMAGCGRRPTCGRSRSSSTSAASRPRGAIPTCSST
jgi:predicted glycosyltransferase